MRAPEYGRLLFLVALVGGGVLALMLFGTRRAPSPSAELDSAEITSSEHVPHELTAPEAGESDADAVPVRRAQPPAGETSIRADTATAAGEIRGVVRSRDEAQKIVSGRVILSAAPATPTEPAGPDLSRDGKYWSRTFRLDGNGEFHFTGLEPGRYRLVFDATEMEQRTEVVHVVADGTAKVEAIVDPTYAMKLELVLQREFAPGKFMRLQASAFESIGPLRAVLLETCPPVGADLAFDARRIVARTREPRDGGHDVWMVASLENPKAGCACVLLGDRVIAAVPFEAGQKSVKLCVKQDDVTCCRCKLDVVVLDHANRLTIPDASVELVWSGGVRRELRTNSHGLARSDDLVSGEVRAHVTAPGYMNESRRLSLATGGPVRLETVELQRSVTLRGTVRFPASGPMTYSVTARRLDSADKKPQRSVSCNVREFEVLDLVPGEYAVGIVPGPRVPDPEKIRRGEVEGWQIVVLPAVASVEFEITDRIAQRIRAWQAR